MANQHLHMWKISEEQRVTLYDSYNHLLLPIPWGKHLQYACGYRYQGKYEMKTRIRRRREGKITERRHKRELGRRGQRWNRMYEKSTDTWNKKGTNLIY